MVSFVILHYLNTEDTIACIESIRNHVIFPEYSLVLVDNASPNHSGEILAARYEKTPDIHLLRLKKNLGFAEGNNAGYQYARNVLNSNFILVINNDTIIEQPDFIKLITEKYDQFQYDILGPDIISLKDNSHQNPRIEILTDESTIKGFIKRYILMHFLSMVNLDLAFLKAKKILFPKSNVAPKKLEKQAHEREAANVKLHGSALIFSPSFIQQFNRCFYPGTFMYCEESILNYIATIKGLVTLYFPKVKMFHKEDGATDSYLKTSRRKREFYYKYFVKSSRVLLKLYRDGFNMQDMQ